MKVDFLNYDEEAGAEHETISGAMSDLMNAKIKTAYKTLTAEQTESKVEGVWRMRDLISTHGVTGPGKGDPEIELQVKVEGEFAPEPEDLHWDELTEIKGIGETRVKEIKAKLLGEDDEN